MDTRDDKIFEEMATRMDRMEARSAHIIIDGDGVIVKWGEEATELLGWMPEDAVGTPLVELAVPKHLQDAHRAGLQQWRETETAMVLNEQLPTQAVHKGGFLVPVVVTVQMIRDDAGVKFLGWVVPAHGV